MRRGVLVTLAVMLMFTARPVSASDPVPVRIMMLGDSTTQGSAGDWTWRYWLWRHLQADGVNADFVGPNTDLYDELRQQSGSQAYADPAFDRDHASQWGAGLTHLPVDVPRMVLDYQPDVILVLLGVNDLTWLGESVPTAVAHIGTLVEQAREAKPDTSIILGQLPWPWIPGVQEYNAGLDSLARQMDTPQSPVRLAAFGEFTQCQQTYDWVHSSAAGDVSLATGFASALSALGIGTATTFPAGTGPPVPRQVATVSATPGDAVVTLSWQSPPGATHEWIWLRDVTASGPWEELPFAMAANTLTVGPLINTHEYRFRLQAGKGCQDSDVFADEVAATPLASHLSQVNVIARWHGLDISWQPVAGSAQYQVRVGSRRRVTTQDRGVSVSGLRAGRAYLISVAAAGSSAPPVVTTAVPLGPRPPAPAPRPSLRHTLRWKPVESATRFQIRRRGHTRWHTVAWTHRRRYSGPPGGYLITAWHQDLEGGTTRVVLR